MAVFGKPYALTARQDTIELEGLHDIANHVLNAGNGSV
jgi:hypothetical protein